MKLKAYSKNNQTKHLIIHTLTRYFWLPLVIFATTVILFPGIEMISENRFMNFLLQSDNPPDYIFRSENFWGVFPYILIILSVFSAYAMFSFLFKKKHSTMLMLSGVSRTNLFLNRYLFGFISLSLPTMISLLILLIIGGNNANGRAFKEDTPYIILMAFAIMLFTYTVSVIAAVLSGRKIEFFIISIVAIFGVHAITFFLAAIFASYMHGFAYPISGNNDLPYRIINVFDKYSDLSINTLFNKAFIDYPRSGYNTIEGDMIDLSEYALELIILYIICLLLIIATIFIFRNRNSEIDEKPNGNIVVSSVCSVVIALTLSSVLFLFGNSLIVLIGFFAAFIVLFGLFLSVFNGTVRNILKSTKISIPAAGLVGVLVLFVSFDLFGYSSKIPEINEVESVIVTYKGSGDTFLGKGISIQKDVFQSTYIDFSSYPVLTTEEDIGKAISLHKKLIEDGSMRTSSEYEQQYSETVVYSDFYIVYKLKNGDELIRCYPQMKLSTLYETMSIGDTDAYKAHFRKSLSEKENMVNNLIAISDNMLSDYTEMELDDGKRETLINAIATDKYNETYNKKYHPEKECLGVIWLGVRIQNAFDTESGQTFSYPIVEDPVFIYNDDVNTINFLKENDYFKYFDSKYTIKSIELYELDYNKFDYDFTRGRAIDRYYTAQFNKSIVHEHNSDIFNKICAFDEDEFDDILPACRLEHFTDCGNIYAIITLINSDGEEIITTKYVNNR